MSKIKAKQDREPKSFKKCNIRTMPSNLNISIYKRKNQQLQVLVKVSFVFIILNKLKSDQTLIQIKRLEKVQHIDSAQRSQTDSPSQ